MGASSPRRIDNLPSPERTSFDAQERALPAMLLLRFSLSPKGTSFGA